MACPMAGRAPAAKGLRVCGGCGRREGSKRESSLGSPSCLYHQPAPYPLLARKIEYYPSDHISAPHAGPACLPHIPAPHASPIYVYDVHVSFLCAPHTGPRQPTCGQTGRPTQYPQESRCPTFLTPLQRRQDRPDHKSLATGCTVESAQGRPAVTRVSNITAA